MQIIDEDETKSRSSAILKWEDEVDESISNFKQDFEKLFKINHELESKITEISKVKTYVRIYLMSYKKRVTRGIKC